MGCLGTTRRLGRRVGYHLDEAGKKSSLKHFYISEIALDGLKSSDQTGNLIEGLFVVGDGQATL